MGLFGALPRNSAALMVRLLQELQELESLAEFQGHTTTPKGWPRLNGSTFVPKDGLTIPDH